MYYREGHLTSGRVEASSSQGDAGALLCLYSPYSSTPKSYQPLAEEAS